MQPNARALTGLALIIVTCANLLGAAHVFGTIFDETIQPAHRSAVQINTIPQQELITLNGSYSFNVPPGTYRLNAVGENTSAEKNVTIQSEGDFRIDLILLPGVPAEDSVLTDLLSAPEVQPPATTPNEGIGPIWIIIGGLFIAMAVWAYVNRKRFGLTTPINSIPKTNTPSSDPVSVAGRVLSADQQKVMQALGSFNNRASQKDLRRALDRWSEAKVSMELSELEDLGVIQKIKKGRGNIIRKN